MLKYLMIYISIISLILMSFNLYFFASNEYVYHENISTNLHQADYCYVTVSSLNEFGFVLSLYESLISSKNNIGCFHWYVVNKIETKNSVIIETLNEIKDQVKDKFSMFYFEDITKNFLILNLKKLGFMYNDNELKSILIPFALHYSLRTFNLSYAIFLDNDVWVTDSLQDIHHLLSTRSFVLTPHYINPLPEIGRIMWDGEFLSNGILSTALIGVSMSPKTDIFLDWWCNRASVYGFVIDEHAVDVDQAFLSYIPAFFDDEDYMILRDVRYNIAYWNLHYSGQLLYLDNGIPFLNHSSTGKLERVGFFHFTGLPTLLKGNQIRDMDEYLNRFVSKEYEVVTEVFEEFGKILLSNRTLRYLELPSSYNQFSDGTIITKWMREIYSAIVFPHPKITRYGHYDYNPLYKIRFSPFIRLDFQRRVHADPFCCSKSCIDGDFNLTFLDWLLTTTPNFAVDLHGKFYFSTIEDYLWNKRVDLQLAFPKPTGEDFEKFKVWFSTYPVKEGWIEQKLYNKWLATYRYQGIHHNEFHESPLSKNIGLNVIGWHTGQFSIGIVALKLVSASVAAKISVNAIELDTIPEKFFSTPSSMNISLTRSCREVVNVFVFNPLETHIGLREIPRLIWKHKYNIGFWHWELDVLPEELMSFGVFYDEIWVPSLFVKKSIERAKGYNGTLIKIIPHPVILDDYISNNTLTLSDSFRTLNDHDLFKFLVIFDCRSNYERKNPESAIRAFIDAFPDKYGLHKGYRLIIKSHSCSSREIGLISRFTTFDYRIELLNKIVSYEENKALQKMQDCYVSTHRSEGYGMNIIESLQNGVPVIATNYSGNVDFNNAFRQFLNKCYFAIPYKLVTPQNAYGPYSKGQKWAEPTHDDIVLAMRTVVTQNCKAQYGSQISKITLDNYGVNAVGNLIGNLLEESRSAIQKKVQERHRFR